jgi:hypothetical protein
MATTKPFHLTVSLRPRPILPAIRQATFKVEKKIGYRYFEYGENVEIQDLKPISEIMEAVLNLITPARALNKEELKAFEVSENSGWLAIDDLEPKQAEEFLNTFGQIGLANYYRREAMTNLITPAVFIGQAKIPYRYLEILKEEDSAVFRKRIRRIYLGEEIPFSWVEDDLRKLAKIIRVKVALDKNKSIPNNYKSTMSTADGKYELIKSQLGNYPNNLLLEEQNINLSTFLISFIRSTIFFVAIKLFLKGNKSNCKFFNKWLNYYLY